MFIEEPFDEATPKQVATWERQAPIVRAEILGTVKEVLHEVMCESNALCFEQSEEGLEALAAVLMEELGERLSDLARDEQYIKEGAA